MVVVAVVVVATVVVEVRVLMLVKLVKLVKLISVYFFDILTSTRRRLARERKRCFSSSSEDGSRKR